MASQDVWNKIQIPYGGLHGLNLCPNSPCTAVSSLYSTFPGWIHRDSHMQGPSCLRALALLCPWPGGLCSDSSFALAGIKGHSPITVYGVLPEPPPPNPSEPHPPLPSLPPTPATRVFLLHSDPCICFSFCPKHPDSRCLCSSPLPLPFLSAACSLLSCLVFYRDLWL